jgi:hypothetical protein
VSKGINRVHVDEKKTFPNKRRERGADYEIKHEIPRRSVEKKTAPRGCLSSHRFTGENRCKLVEKQKTKPKQNRNGLEKFEMKGKKCGNEASTLEIKLDDDEISDRKKRNRKVEEKKAKWWGKRRRKSKVQENLDKFKCEKLDLRATGGDFDCGHCRSFGR